MVLLDGASLVAESNSDEGQEGQGTVFEYPQDGDMIWAEHPGGAVHHGHLVDRGEGDRLEFRYVRLDRDGVTSTEYCASLIEPGEMLRLHESCGGTRVQVRAPACCVISSMVVEAPGGSSRPDVRVLPPATCRTCMISFVEPWDDASMPHNDNRRDLARWSHQWFVAALLQAQRAISAFPADSVGFSQMETELLMFVDALNNARRGAAATLGSQHESVKEFDDRVPGLKRLRDQLEHHDEYAVGRGRLQKKAEVRPGDQWWTLTLSGRTHWADEGARRHGVQFGVMSKALSGEGAQAREVASVEIDLIPAVRAAAKLLRAVLKAVEISPTRFLDEADDWCAQLGLPPTRVTPN